MKEPKCKICSGPHYKTWCPKAPRKEIARIAIKRPTYEETMAKAAKASLKPRKPLTHKLSSKTPKPLRRSKVARQSQALRATLIRKADRVFSIYVRRKDAIGDIARCVTCGRQDHYKLMQNGHYISRRVMALRFDELNCHVQCPDCNMRLSGNIPKYRKYLIEKYGLGRIEALEIRGRHGGKLTTHEIESYIAKYEALLKKIK